MASSHLSSATATAGGRDNKSASGPFKQHQQPKSCRVMIPVYVVSLTLLLLLVSIKFDVAESAATGKGSSCGQAATIGQEGTNNVGGTGSAQREGRSSLEDEASLAAAQRSLLRMLPRAEKPRVSMLKFDGRCRSNTDEEAEVNKRRQRGYV